jgi:hypothetical protein
MSELWDRSVKKQENEMLDIQNAALCFDPPTLKLRRASDQSLVRRSAAKAGKLSMRGI